MFCFGFFICSPCICEALYVHFVWPKGFLSFVLIFYFSVFFCAACQMYCILKDVKVYFNFWKQIKYHDVRKTFSLSALCIIIWFRPFLLVGGVLLCCWRKCWQRMFVQNRREVQTLHFFSLNFKMVLLSSWCALALVRFTHQKHSVRLRRTSCLDYNNCFGRHKQGWRCPEVSLEKHGFPIRNILPMSQQTQPEIIPESL